MCFIIELLLLSLLLNFAGAQESNWFSQDSCRRSCEETCNQNTFQKYLSDSYLPLHSKEKAKFLVDLIDDISDHRVNIILDRNQTSIKESRDIFLTMLRNKVFSSILLQPFSHKVKKAFLTNDVKSGFIALTPNLSNNVIQKGQKWLILYSKANLQQVENVVNLTIDSDIYLYRKVASNALLIDLYEAYRRTKEENMMFRKIGQWSGSDGLDVSIPDKWERRKDLSGINIQVTTLSVEFIEYQENDIILSYKPCLLQNNPYILTIPKDNNTVTISGFIGDIFQLIQNVTNFT